MPDSSRVAQMLGLASVHDQWRETFITYAMLARQRARRNLAPMGPPRQSERLAATRAHPAISTTLNSGTKHLLPHAPSNEA